MEIFKWTLGTKTAMWNYFKLFNYLEVFFFFSFHGIYFFSRLDSRFHMMMPDTLFNIEQRPPSPYFGLRSILAQWFQTRFFKLFCFKINKLSTQLKLYVKILFIKKPVTYINRQCFYYLPVYIKFELYKLVLE